MNLNKIIKEKIGRDTTEYNSWRAMKERCTNKKHIEYHRYGERGIEMCERWLNSSQSFFDDMGRKPGSNYSIDRINPEGGYRKDNCRWATHTEQQRNKRNSTVLSDYQVMCIRSVPRKAANGRGPGYTRKDIADMFDLTKATTVRILDGRHHLCN